MATRTIHLLAGDKVRIDCPIDTDSGVGYFAKHGSSGTINHKGEQRTLVNGFLSHDESVGTVEPIHGEPAVIYTHNIADENQIYFYSEDDKIGMVNIISVVIHDHSSIVTGGPAYGTYFSDDDVDVD